MKGKTMNTIALIAPATGQTTLGELVVQDWISPEDWCKTHPEARTTVELAKVFGIALTPISLVKTTLTTGVEEFYEAVLTEYTGTPVDGGAHAGETLPLYEVIDVTVPETEIPDSISEEELNDL